MGLLDGKVAFITGGASGIGKGAALRFAAEGARIGIADMQGDEGEQALQEVEQAGGKALFQQCDVSRPEDVQHAIEATIAAFGKLDIAFANAGINGLWAPIEELPPDEWDKTINTNLRSTYLTVHVSGVEIYVDGGASLLR